VGADAGIDVDAGVSGCVRERDCDAGVNEAGAGIGAVGAAVPRRKQLEWKETGIAWTWKVDRRRAYRCASQQRNQWQYCRWIPTSTVRKELRGCQL
jgi:hypothetical protein